MAHSIRHDNDLESKICEMSTYLDRLVTGTEIQSNSNTTPVAGMEQTILPHGFMPSGSHATVSNPSNILPHTNSTSISTPCQLTNVTSALASRMNTTSSTLRFVHPVPHQRSKKWGNYKQSEKDPDTSDIDVDATMVELGLTPDSLTNNEVYRLFSFYNKLAFYIHAAYIFEDIYEARSLPNTMNVSVQTRHAVWSSNKLLRHLRDALRKYTHVPAEYQISLSQCKQSLEELHTAILKLESFKYCSLEHRKGKFISSEGHENLKPLMESLKEVMECIGKSRMFVEVLIWALQKAYIQVNEATVDVSCGVPEHPVMLEESLRQTINGRPLAARRYIG